MASVLGLLLQFSVNASAQNLSVAEQQSDDENVISVDLSDVILREPVLVANYEEDFKDLLDQHIEQDLEYLDLVKKHNNEVDSDQKE